MAGWILDILFFALILLGIGFGAWRGLFKSVCKMAGTVFSVSFAFIFCISFSNALEGWFGLETLLAAKVGTLFASILSIIISFVGLVILVKLGAFLLGVLGKTFVKQSKLLNSIDRFFGGLLGGVMALLLIFFLLAVCSWINTAGLNAYIDSSYVVKAVYHWDWFVQAAHLKIW